MKLITRISMRFDPREDRLCLRLVEHGGEVLHLWLTWRLANVLVDGLLAVVEEAAPADPPVTKAASTSGTATASQFWAQTKAEMGIDRTPKPAVPPPIGTIALVHRLALRRVPDDDRYFLELHWPDDSAVLPLDERYLRQLLTLLHRGYKMAGWSPKCLWPVWLGDSAHRSVLGSNEIN